MPCYKLAAKFHREDILQRFLDSRRSGFYFSVEQEGIVAAGESFDFVSRDEHAMTIAEMNQLFAADRYNSALTEKALNTAALPLDWKEYFSNRAARAVAHLADQN